MTANIVNLRRKRRQQARADRAAHAAENRARFGRRGAEKAGDQATRHKAIAHLDGHRLKTANSDQT
ncbi:MAG: DUF4169 family protein, partial [Alphaproteobacteria bacterium]|nr:DUF4169 family protein [Alphaproteobacteria bacterium]